VATVRALKFHGGVEVAELQHENLRALEAGAANLDRHIDNVREQYGLPCVVAINQRAEDTPAELRQLVDLVSPRGVKVIVARHFAEGGKGALEVAKEVVRLCEQRNDFKFIYDDDMRLWDKIKTVATRIYHAADIDADAHVRAQIERLQSSGYG